MMTPLRPTSPPPGEPIEIRIWRRRAFMAGLAGAALAALGFLTSREQFFHSYLLAYLFWLGIALGCHGVVMLHNMTGGAWGVVVRRLLEAATRTLPLMALLFVPILLGLSHLYEWSRPEAVASDALLRHKSAYLNAPFVAVRAAFYFAVWIGISHILNRWSSSQDEPRAAENARRLKLLSAPGILLYVLTMTFASIDWVMSLDAHWFSTIYGVLFIVGQAMSAFAFAICVLVLLKDREPFAGIVSKVHFHDLGNLLFAFLMLWAYVSLSQLLIIWSGNLPEEIPWYMRRFHGGWEWVGYALVIFHFTVPFFLLLSRAVKQSARALARVSVAIIAMRLVDLFWMIAPEIHGTGFHVHWLDLIMPVAIGGLWLAAYFRELGAGPLLAARDLEPDVEEAHAAG